MAEMTPEERAHAYLATTALPAMHTLVPVIHAAVQAEREANCEAMCELCRGTPYHDSTPVLYHGRWVHHLNAVDLSDAPVQCDAAAIRARGEQDPA